MSETLDSYRSDEPTAFTTDDFVESFADTTEFNGGFFRIMYLSRILPNGIDTDDSRVKAILSRLDRWYAIGKEEAQ